MKDDFYMSLAIDEAWQYQGLTYPNPAVGAVVVEDGRILSIEAHQKAGESHAEVRALLKAYETISKRKSPVEYSNADEAHDFLLSLPEGFFSKSTIYITLEPCSHRGKTPSCAYLISKLGLKRVVIATLDPNLEHSGGVDILLDAGVDFDIGVLEDEAKRLIEPFVIWQKRAFVLFKLAQSVNGRIGGGYLSSKESLVYVHRLREVADRLVIGGSTVRIDRPRLDCRFTNGKAPDITIYSKEESFDETIPLFGVENREVEIVSDLEPLFEKPSFLLIEGGEGMLKALEKRIDWFLIFLTPKLSTNLLSYNIDKKISFLSDRRIGDDIMIWSSFE